MTNDIPVLFLERKWMRAAHAWRCFIEIPSDGDLPAILTALKYESRQAALKSAFWSRAETLIREIFGSWGSASLGGEYQSRDYDLVDLAAAPSSSSSRFKK